jgi:hypothetical protein
MGCETSQELDIQSKPVDEAHTNEFGAKMGSIQFPMTFEKEECPHCHKTEWPLIHVQKKTHNYT